MIQVVLDAPHCQTVGIYDKALNDNAIAKRMASNQNRRSNHW